MTPRLSRRLARHHLPLAVLTLASGTALYVTRDYADVISRLSFASAWPALLLLTVTLLIGPWRKLTRRDLPVSQDLRRDIGIWAGITGLFHTGIGQCVHLRGRPWLYYVYEDRLAIRHDTFGLANETGLIAALILLLLLATSNDASLRKLGLARWKTWQRWNYAGFAFAVLHGFGYLLGIESVKAAWIALACLSVLTALTLQIAAWRKAPDFAICRKSVRNGTISRLRTSLCQTPAPAWPRSGN